MRPVVSCARLLSGDWRRRIWSHQIIYCICNSSNGKKMAECPKEEEVKKDMGVAVQPETGSAGSASSENEAKSGQAQSYDGSKKSTSPTSEATTPSTKTPSAKTAELASTPVSEAPTAKSPAPTASSTPVSALPSSVSTSSSAKTAEPASTSVSEAQTAKSTASTGSSTPVSTLPSSVSTASYSNNDAREEAHQQAKEEFFETLQGVLGTEESDSSDDDHYQPIDLIRIVVPVVLCMLFVVLFTVLITDPQEERTRVKPMMALAPFDSKTDDVGKKALETLGNVGILIGTVAVMTFLVVGLYMCYCYKCLLVILAIPVVVVNLVFTWAYFNRVLRAFNVPMDHITAALLSINFGVIGIMSILGRTPKILQQFYLLYLCGVMASLYLSYMPDWTVWGFLAALAIWDLIAVLTPCGPLRILIETVQTRDHDFIPAMIYTTAAYNMADKDDKGGKKNKKGMNKAWKTGGDIKSGDGSEDIEPKEKRRLRLGLGDFVFYSLLTGKATQQTIVHSIDVDWTVVICCFLAIIAGLLGTVILLVMAKKALPALPISIALGLIFYFAGVYVISDFCALMSTSQIFI